MGVQNRERNAVSGSSPYSFQPGHPRSCGMRQFVVWPGRRLNAVLPDGSERPVAILRSLFGRMGLPEQVVSDNGPQFVSGEFNISQK